MTSNTNPKTPDVRDCFNAIRHTRPLDTVVVGNPHVEVVKSHVQGVATLGDGYLLTHSNVEGDAGRLLVVDGQRNATTVVLPALTLDGVSLNHPGGCQRVGDFLIIPFEAVQKNVSRVSVFDLSAPTRPIELTTPAPIERHDRKAGAAGVANVTIAGSEFWFLGVYDNGRVDVFRSDGRAFPNTEFTLQFVSSIPDGYESFCLVAEASNDLFAIGFRRDSRGQDKADLYMIHLDTARLELLASRRFVTNGLRTVHFRWGAGLAIHADGTFAIVATGRNFLPGPLIETETGTVDALSPQAQAGFTSHCHINTFSRA